MIRNVWRPLFDNLPLSSAGCFAGHPVIVAVQRSPISCLSSPDRRCASDALSQRALSDHPKALVVIAHPDDDAAFSSVLYQLTHQLDRTVDLALVTDGSGGYRYSTLAEEIYGVEFTNEEVARQHLPAIRKQ